MIARILGPQVIAEVCLAPSVPAVLINPGQLDQVLVNLAVNARDAMPQGGTFTLATEVREGTGPGSSTLAISVGDTGCGMDAATVAKAFEPFFTTKGEQGTGLGLAVVHGIVHQAGGRSRVRASLTGHDVPSPSSRGERAGQILRPRR